MENEMDKILSLFPKGSGQFSQSFLHFNREWGKMLQFQTIVTMGLPPAEAKYSDYIMEFMQELKPTGRFPNLLIDNVKYFKEGKDKEFATAGARDVVEHSISVANSMTLMWGHTILENELQRFLNIILSISPESYYDKLNNQNVSIQQVRNNEFESILLEKATKFVDELERKSIIEKCDELLRILGSEHLKYSHKTYKYDRNTLIGINERRHDVAHGRNLTLTRSQVDDDLDYLFHTYGYFLFLMNEKFQLKIAPYDFIIDALNTRDKSQ